MIEPLGGLRGFSQTAGVFSRVKVGSPVGKLALRLASDIRDEAPEFLNGHVLTPIIEVTSNRHAVAALIPKPLVLIAKRVDGREALAII